MVAVAILPADGTMTTLLLTLLMGAVVSAVITPWTSSVLALLYIDTRIRKENLAFSLIRATMRP
jgi:hypothetical protein